MHTAAVRIHSALIGSWRCSATPPMAMAPTIASRAAEIFLIMLLPRVAAATPAHAAALTHSGRERPPARDGVRHSPASLPRARESGSTVAALRHAYGHPLRRRRP